MVAASIDYRFSSFKKRSLDDGWVDTFRSDPVFATVYDALLLKLEGNPVEDIVSDVFFVGNQFS